MGTYLGGRETSGDGVVLLHAVEDEELVENIDEVHEAVADEVALEVDGREQHVFELALVGAEVGHDLHADVQQLVFANGVLHARADAPRDRALSDEHPFEEVDGGGLLVGSSRDVVEQLGLLDRVGQGLREHRDVGHGRHELFG